MIFTMLKICDERYSKAKETPVVQLHLVQHRKCNQDAIYGAEEVAVDDLPKDIYGKDLKLMI